MSVASLEVTSPSASAPVSPASLSPGFSSAGDRSVRPVPPSPPSLSPGLSGEEDFTDPESLLPDWFLEGSVVTEGFRSDLEGVTSVLVEIHQRARVLKRLPPLHLWRWKQKRVWERSTRAFVPYLGAALREGAGHVVFLKACLRLLELPFLILASTLPE